MDFRIAILNGMAIAAGGLMAQEYAAVSNNPEVLAELSRLLRFSQGEFALIVAVCNASEQRQELVNQLRQQCNIPFDEMTLPASSTTLFTSLRHHVSDPLPAALMVYGLDEVFDLRQFLVAANQVREAFRKLPLPLVLWLTDAGLKQLIRTAPDFYSWANTVTFDETGSKKSGDRV